MKKVMVNIVCLLMPSKKIRMFIRDFFNVGKKSKIKDFKSANYWDERYKKGGNSGAGSYNNLAQFKADIINTFVKDNNINNVVEFGSGDGNNAKLYKINNYLGVDVSFKAVEITTEMFKDDKTKNFITLENYNKNKIKSEMSMSLDVIYHLVEDEVFNSYMDSLINSATKYVMIYSSNIDEIRTTHVKHRKFTNFIEKNYPNLKLISKIDNKFPYEEENPDHTSFADFYIYKVQN